MRKVKKSVKKKVRIANDLDNVVSLRFDNDLLNMIKAEAKQCGLPVSLTMRMIIKKYFNFKSQ